MRTTVSRARQPAAALALAAAWLGGVAFAGSLATFAYVYLVRFGRPVQVADIQSATRDALVVDVLLFALFACHHSVMARDRVKRWLARWLAPAFERTLYVWVASLLFGLLCWAWRDVPGELYRFDGWWRWPFYLAQAGGALLAVGSARTLDVLELAGIRQVQRAIVAPAPWAGLRAEGPPGPLQTAGPYRFVRHPVYLGWLVLVFGSPVMTANRWTFAVLSLLYLIVGVAFEERALGRAFGPAYEAYRRRVRWRLVPGVY